MERYLKKENYITSRPNPKDWEFHFNNDVLKRYKNEIKGVVLDFGCNHGSTTFFICDNKNVTYTYGLDINLEAIKVGYTTKKKQYKDSKIDFLRGNIMDYQFDKKFDTIVSFHTIEHIYEYDIEHVLNKLYNVLKNDGYFIISIPYKKSYNDSTHVAYYDEKTLPILLEKCGFKTIECLSESGSILTGLFKKEKNE